MNAQNRESSNRDIAVIMPAAGSGRRFGRDDNKLFAMLGDQPIWLITAKRLRKHPRVARIVMPVSAVDRPRFEKGFSESIADLHIELCDGGAERTDSVQAAVNCIGDDPNIHLVAVHDAARPLIRQNDLDAVFAMADQTGAAILATPVTATVKQTFDRGKSCRTIDRNTLWLAQTPQVFRRETFRKAYEKYRGKPATDDAELVQRIGIDVALVAGSQDNLKITHPNDLEVAEAILDRENKSIQAERNNVQ